MSYAMARASLEWKMEAWRKLADVKQIIHHRGDRILENAFLVEMVLYENGSAHIVYLDRAGESFTFRESCRVRHQKPEGVTVSLVCNDVEPYASYCEVIEQQARGLGMEVVVAKRLGPFDMAAARNESLERCETDHVLMLDVDVDLTADFWDGVQRAWTTASHCGVLNIKNAIKSGNGLYFGKRDLLMANGYDERFKFYWCEDTEFLMNFSRVDIFPMVVFLGFEHRPHDRIGTTKYVNRNNGLFARILLNGRGITE